MSNESVLPSVTVSLGIAGTGKEATAELLLVDVDSALYRVKQKGRSCIWE